MSSLRNLFHQPTVRPICGVKFSVFKLAFEQFDDGITVGTWLNSLEEKDFSIEQLDSLKAGTPERLALERLIAGGLSVYPDDQSVGATPLTQADVAVMPAMMVAEAVAVLMEVNADFFFQTLPKLLEAANRIKSTGSGLLNNLSAPATA